MPYGLTQALQTVRGTSTAYRADDPDQLGDITVESWVYITSLAAGQSHAVIAKDDTNTQRQWALTIDENGASTELALRWFGSGNGRVAVVWVPTPGVYYHLAYTRSASSGSVIFYVNGLQQGSTQSTTAGNYVNSTAQFMVGARGSNSSIQDGLSANFSLARVWSVVRSQAQIEADMCNVLGPTANLLAEWTFNNTYNDNSGNSRTLTPQGSPTFPANNPSVCLPSFNPSPMMHHMEIAGGLM